MPKRPGGGLIGPPIKVIPTAPSALSPSSSGLTGLTEEQKATTTPESMVALAWYATPAASASNTQMSRAGVATALAVPMPFRGSIVAITLSGTANKTAGTATFSVRKNASIMLGSMLTWPNSTQRVTSRFAKGDLGFVRDDRLDVVFTTSSSYSPTTTVVEVIVWATQDSEEVI